MSSGSGRRHPRASSSPWWRSSALSAACGLGLSTSRHRDVADDFDDDSAPRRKAASSSPIGTRRTTSTPDEPGWGIVSLGALAHGVMSLRCAARRWRERRARAAEDDLPLPAARPRRGAGEAGLSRREPSLGGGARRVRGRPGGGSVARRGRRGLGQRRRPCPPSPHGEARARRGPRRAPCRRPEARAAHGPRGAALAPRRRRSTSFRPSPSWRSRRSTSARSCRPTRWSRTPRLLEGTLEDFGVKGEIINVRPGPVVTLYELEPAPGIKSSRVISLADDIARSMSAISARVAVVPGRNAIGIELPNQKRETVYLRELLASPGFRDHEAEAAALPRQDHRRRAGDRRSRAHAAPARRRHHRLGQVGRHQHHDPVAALPADAGGMPADHGRSEDARAVGL